MKNPQSLDQILQTIQTAKEQSAQRSTASTSSLPRIDLNREWRIYLASFRRVCPSWSQDRIPLSLLQGAFRWIWGLKGCPYDLNKGFLIFGPLGVGKSTLMYGIQKYCNHITDTFHRSDYRIGFTRAAAAVIANAYATNGAPGISKYHDAERNLCIDELGREPIPASNFGTKCNVLQLILQLRYDNRYSSVTHITTNLTPDDIEPVYGDYIADRVKELFNIIHLNGTSLR